MSCRLPEAKQIWMLHSQKCVFYFDEGERNAKTRGEHNCTSRHEQVVEEVNIDSSDRFWHFLAAWK